MAHTFRCRTSSNPVPDGKIRRSPAPSFDRKLAKRGRAKIRQEARRALRSLAEDPNAGVPLPGTTNPFHASIRGAAV